MRDIACGSWRYRWGVQNTEKSLRVFLPNNKWQACAHDKRTKREKERPER